MEKCITAGECMPEVHWFILSVTKKIIRAFLMLKTAVKNQICVHALYILTLNKLKNIYFNTNVHSCD
jgi:hypothetical protein